MIRAFATALAREFRLAARQKLEWLMAPLFCLIVVTLFGLGAKPNDPQLAAFAPAILWVAALLAALLTVDRPFRNDYEDGSLEQIFLAPDGAFPTVAAKLLAHWLLTGLPLSLLAAPLALELGFAGPALPVLVAGLLLGTPVLSLIGGFAAALTVGLPRAGVLLPVLVLPMVTPVLVFGAGAARTAQAGLEAAAPLYFLAAVLVLCVTLLPLLATAALRNAFD